MNRAPYSFASAATSRSGCSTPVEVSAWTMVTSFTRSCFFSSASSISAGNGLPHSLSRTTTFAPIRSAMSSIRCPKKPQTHMITVSPGSSRLLIPTSMPADPVPDTDSVRPSSVSKTRLSSSDSSSMIFMKSGSRYPIIGAIIACRTRGCAVLGPGPRRMRSGNDWDFRVGQLAGGHAASCLGLGGPPLAPDNAIRMARPVPETHYRLAPVGCPRLASVTAHVSDDAHRSPSGLRRHTLTLPLRHAYNCLADTWPPNTRPPPSPTAR